MLVRRDKEMFRRKLVHNPSFGCRPLKRIYHSRSVPLWLALSKRSQGNSKIPDHTIGESKELSRESILRKNKMKEGPKCLKVCYTVDDLRVFVVASSVRNPQLEEERLSEGKAPSPSFRRERKDRMSDPYAELVKLLEHTTLQGPATLSPEVRQTAARAALEEPDVVQRYVEKVAKHAYTVTDEDVQQLLKAGYSEDQIFELTVSVALGAGLTRLTKGLASLEEGDNDATARA